VRRSIVWGEPTTSVAMLRTAPSSKPSSCVHLVFLSRASNLIDALSHDAAYLTHQFTSLRPPTPTPALPDDASTPPEADPPRKDEGKGQWPDSILFDALNRDAAYLTQAAQPGSSRTGARGILQASYKHARSNELPSAVSGAPIARRL
jgi:hypothetical protein